MNRLPNAPPVWVDDMGSPPVRLERLAGSGWAKVAADETANENTLQAFLARCPEVLPLSEFSSVFGPAVCIAREGATAVGPIDLLFMSEQGRLIVIETKLHKNPEARREVIAQVQDYADQVTRWQYADVDDRARLWYEKNAAPGAPGWPGLAKYVLSKFADPASEAAIDADDFVDDIERALQRGEFLVLIVSDQIRERTLSLVEFANQHTTSRIEYGLVELAFFRRADTKSPPFIVVPNIVSKTTIVERIVVTVQDASGRRVPAQVVRQEEREEVRTQGRKPQLASREGYLERVAPRVPSEVFASVESVLEVFEDVADRSDGLFEIGFASTSCGLYWRESASQTRRIMGLTQDGALVVRPVYLKYAGAEDARAELVSRAASVVDMDPDAGGKLYLTSTNTPAVIEMIRSATASVTPLLRARSQGI